MPRRSLRFTQAEIDFCERYREKKGMRDIADLLRIALHAYVARNKARGIEPPWDDDRVVYTGSSAFARCEEAQEGD